MPHWLDFILGGIIGLTVGIVGSLLTGLGCLFGSESGCTNFPQYFGGVTFFGPPLTGIAVLVYVLLHPRASLRALYRFIAWLHYFFVPHPAESAINAGRRYRTPEKIDPKDVVQAMKRDGPASLDPRNMPPAYQSENQRKKAEALREAAEADRKLLEELEEREWARRRLEKAKRGEK